MSNLIQIKQQIALALASIIKYENNPTKAESKRIRLTLGEIKKLVTPVRSELITADKV